jgi:hypothetical protein
VSSRRGEGPRVVVHCGGGAPASGPRMGWNAAGRPGRRPVVGERRPQADGEDGRGGGRGRAGVVVGGGTARVVGAEGTAMKI